MNGQHCIRDLRLTICRVLVELLATYPDRQQLFQEFPELEKDSQQARIFTSSYVGDRIVELLKYLSHSRPVSVYRPDFYEEIPC